MNSNQKDTLLTVEKQLNFMSDVILAWDLDAIEIDSAIMHGFYHMLNDIKEELIAVNFR